MIVTITGYRKKGDYSPEVIKPGAVEDMVKNSIDLVDLLKDFQSIRDQSLALLMSQPGFISGKWINGVTLFRDGGPKEIYRITYYLDEDSFIKSVQSYKSSDLFSSYVNLRNEFCKIFGLEYIEYGSFQVDNENLTLSQVDEIINQKKYTDWPLELSIKNN